MARLGLKNYQNPNFAIPSIAPDQRPLNQLSKFGQWLHSVYDWKVDGDENGSESGSEPSNINESGTEVSPTSTADRSWREGDTPMGESVGYDPASETEDEAYLAGKEAEGRASEDFAKSMEEAFRNAQKAKGDKLQEMMNAAAIGSSGPNTEEVQDFLGFEGDRRDGIGGHDTFTSLMEKLYDDSGAGAERITAVEPEAEWGWATDSFDPSTISKEPAKYDSDLEDVDNTGNQQYRNTPRGGYRGH